MMTPAMGVRVREKVKGSGVWWVFIRHKGKRRSKCVGDKRAAERLASRIRQRIGAAEFQLLPKRVPTFAAFADEWLERPLATRSVSPNTAEAYTRFVRHHLIPFFGQTPISAITPDRVEMFVVSKRSPAGPVRFKKPLAESSLRLAMSTLWLILKRAVKREFLAANPAEEAIRSVPTEDRVDPLTPAELRTIFQVAWNAIPSTRSSCACGCSPGCGKERWPRSSGRTSISGKGRSSFAGRGAEAAWGRRRPGRSGWCPSSTRSPKTRWSGARAGRASHR